MNRTLRCATAFFVFAACSGASATLAQSPGPVVDYGSLLDQRFYPATGGFLIDALSAAFVPEGATGEAVVTRGSERVAAVPLRSQRHSTAEAFCYLPANGVPGTLSIGAAGDFVLTIYVNGTAVTALPFTLTRTESGDAFHPQPTFAREGPWRTLGYLTYSADAPADQDPLVDFTAWSSTAEIGGGVSRASATLHVLRGRDEIAVSPVRVISTADWQGVRFEPKKSRNERLRRSDLTNGSYTLVMRAEGRDIKSWTFRVVGGAIEPIGRGRLEHSPTTEMLLPRRVPAMSNTGPNTDEEHVFWLEATAPRRRR